MEKSKTQNSGCLFNFYVPGMDFYINWI